MFISNFILGLKFEKIPTGGKGIIHGPPFWEGQ